MLFHFSFLGKVFASLMRLQHGIKRRFNSLTYDTWCVGWQKRTAAAREEKTHLGGFRRMHM